MSKTTRYSPANIPDPYRKARWKSNVNTANLPSVVGNILVEGPTKTMLGQELFGKTIFDNPPFGVFAKTTWDTPVRRAVAARPLRYGMISVMRAVTDPIKDHFGIPTMPEPRGYDGIQRGSKRSARVPTKPKRERLSAPIVDDGGPGRDGHKFASDGREKVWDLHPQGPLGLGILGRLIG